MAWMLPSVPLTLDHRGSRPLFCKVSRPAHIRGCFGVRAQPDNPLSHFQWHADIAVAVCRHCGAEVTGAFPIAAWREMLAPALPSPNARGNSLRAAVEKRIGHVREFIDGDQPARALDLATVAAWEGHDAIAAGCDDPAGLARDLVALRAEVSAAQR